MNKPLIKKSYCAYCKRQTEHRVLSQPNREVTGGDLVCTRCGSARMDKIQGFDAALM